MKVSLLAPVATVLLIAACALPARAEDILWKLDFKDLKPGATPLATSFAAPCPAPQSITVDEQNTLAGAASVGTLSPALQFTKGSNAHYMPSLTLKADKAITSGVITLNMDVIFDQITPTANHPVETLMALPFIVKDGSSPYILLLACSGSSSLFLGEAGLTKPNPAPTFSTGAPAHLKAVLDLDKHTFQAFLNDVPMGPPDHDDGKFSSFLGLTIRDGTALGGNNGATFTAGLGNIVVTKG